MFCGLADNYTAELGQIYISYNEYSVLQVCCANVV